MGLAPPRSPAVPSTPAHGRCLGGAFCSVWSLQRAFALCLLNVSLWAEWRWEAEETTPRRVPTAIQHGPDVHVVSRPSAVTSNGDAFRLTVPGAEQLSEGGARPSKGRAGARVRWCLCADSDATSRQKGGRAAEKENPFSSFAETCNRVLQRSEQPIHL